MLTNRKFSSPHFLLQTSNKYEQCQNKWSKMRQRNSKTVKTRSTKNCQNYFHASKKIASWIRIHNLETWFFFHPKKFPGYVCLVSVWSYQADWEFVNVNFCTSDWNRTGMEKLFMEKVGIFLLSLSLSLSLFPSLSLAFFLSLPLSHSLSLSLTFFQYLWKNYFFSNSFRILFWINS